MMEMMTVMMVISFGIEHIHLYRRTDFAGFCLCIITVLNWYGTKQDEVLQCIIAGSESGRVVCLAKWGEEMSRAR